MALSTWHDLESARDEWHDAPQNDDQLSTLLDVAQSQVISYAPKLLPQHGWHYGWLQNLYDGPPTLAYEDPVTGELSAVADGTAPMNYRLAQLMQMRNIWNSTKVDPVNAGMGEDTFQIRPFPLDWMVKQVIRPKRGLPWVG